MNSRRRIDQTEVHRRVRHWIQFTYRVIDPVRQEYSCLLIIPDLDWYIHMSLEDDPIPHTM